MATHSSILAWKIPWMEEPGRLQSMGLQRVGHNWATSLTPLHAIVQGQHDKVIPPCLIKSATLPTHTSSPQAELTALTQALTLAKDQKINIYTDSKYVYNTSHFNIIIWRERGFVTQKGTTILNASFISELLHVAQLPNQAAVIYCPGHQWHSPISFYNNIADPKQTSSVSRVPLLVLSLLWPKLTSLTSTHYFHICIPFSNPLQKYLSLSFRTLLSWARTMQLI